MYHDKSGILKERLLKQDRTKGIDFRDDSFCSFKRLHLAGKSAFVTPITECRFLFDQQTWTQNHVFPMWH